MESASFNAKDRPGAFSQLLPVLGPMLLVAVGYLLDPGKWAATVEAGFRYGTDLAAVMFIFNLAAILCHYLSARIAVVTGKDLSQICSEEYDKGTFIFLGVQTEISVMSLLGASIMPHSFYLHSWIVQVFLLLKPLLIFGYIFHKLMHGQHGRLFSSFSHNKMFLRMGCVRTILSRSSAYLVAANAFYTSRGLLTFQDAMSLIEQGFWGPIGPVALLLVLFLSNQITTLSWSLGGKVALNDVLKLELPGWLHSATIRIIAVVPAVYFVWNSGAEGMYQLLVSTQVLAALLLPSSVIPLFRVAASRQIMGTHKMSQFLEFSALIALLGMLGLKFIFVVEMLFGNSDWADNLRWDAGSSMC